jgi:hypothetical protein
MGATRCGMPESAPRNELVLIDPGEWGRIFGPEQLVQIHESSLHQPDGAPAPPKVQSMLPLGRAV